MDLLNKVAVITGGAGIIGSSVAELFSLQGASTLIIDKDRDAVQNLQDGLGEKGLKIQGYTGDIESEDFLENTLDEIIGKFGPVAVLHNNVATKGSNLVDFFANVENYKMETWQEIIKTNLNSLFNVSRLFGTKMAENNSGSIIHMSSIYGGVTAPDQRIYNGAKYLNVEINTPPVYTASKAAIVGLTKHLASYWAPHGVRVNCVSPGGVFSGQNTEFVSNYSARVPMARMANPKEIAEAVLFLASDKSSYITGHNLVVDGGLSIW